MRTRIAALAALLAILLSTTPANTVTRGGIPDAGEHPMVGQLVFYVPDALPSPFGENQPGGWFSCSGTLVSSTVVVTAGHCTFAIGLDGVSATTEDDRYTAADGNGTGGNDVWFSVNEDDDHWDGWPLTFDEDGNLNFPTQQARYEARRDFLNGNPLWIRATSFPHPEYDDRAFYLHDAGVIELAAAQPGPYATIPTADYLEQYAGRRNEHRFEVAGYGLQRAHPVFEIGGDARMKAEPRLLSPTTWRSSRTTASRRNQRAFVFISSRFRNRHAHRVPACGAGRRRIVPDGTDRSGKESSDANSNGRGHGHSEDPRDQSRRV